MIIQINFLNNILVYETFQSNWLNLSIDNSNVIILFNQWLFVHFLFIWNNKDPNLIYYIFINCFDIKIYFFISKKNSIILAKLLLIIYY